jgi:four helix bundle protein
MESFKKFEDINSWKKARELSIKIYQLTNNKPTFKNDFGLRDQMRRACISISSNIAEGFERETNKEFIRFLFIARGSAGEFRSQLYLASDINYISKSEFEELSNSVNEISRLIYGLIKYLKSKL